ncbi:dihydroorotate dehydrogenase, partial [Planctomycetota bacterium]
LRVRLGPISLANPVLSASGTFGYGAEVERFFWPGVLGAIVGKTVTLEPREGNPSPRMAETAAGMLNTIGLQNPGLDHFVSAILPRMLQYGNPVLVNIAGRSVDEFVELAARLDDVEGPAALELNLSCPNVARGGMSFSTTPRAAEEVCSRVAAATERPFYAKLTPNTANVGSVARACEAGGAAGISAINTLMGMAIDWRGRRPLLSTATGGLSGPAIKPVALRVVHEVYRSVSIPVMGIGGARTAEDVLEFMVAGASAVQIGTATFVDPLAIPKVLQDLPRLLEEQGVGSVRELTGTLAT